MRHLISAWVVAAAILVASGARSQPVAPPSDALSQANPDQAQSQGHWYYCDPARAYYPYVRKCQTPWRPVTPTAQHAPAQLTTANDFDDTLNPGCAGLRITSPNSGSCRKPAPEPDDRRNSGAATPDEKSAGDSAYDRCLTNPPSDTMPGAASAFDSLPWLTYRQQWRTRCDEAARTAVVQLRSQAAAQAQVQSQADSAASQHDRAIEAAKSRGYELIPSVKDLILDGKELAARNAKIQITGIYKKAGDNGILYGSPMEAYANSDNYVALLTDEAARPVREALMNYQCQNFGCEIEIGGHMTMCQHLNLLMKDYPDLPCLHVEVQIVYRPGD